MRITGNTIPRCTVLLSVALVGSARAGIVSFDPELTVVDTTLGSTLVALDVSVQSEALGEYDSLSVVINHGSLRLDVWDYDPGFVDALAFPPPPFPGICDPVPCEGFIFAGGFALVPLVGVTAVGAITLDASGLSPGDYEVFVDSDLDFGTSSLGLGTAGEPLFGSAVVRVLPEPATLALLGVGASVCGRRAGRAGRMKSSVRQRAENRFLVATRIEAQSEPIRVVLNWTGGAIIPRHAGDSWNRGRRPEFVRLVTGVT